MPSVPHLLEEAEQNRLKEINERNPILRRGDFTEDIVTEFDKQAALDEFTVGFTPPFSFALIELCKKLKRQEGWAQEHIKNTLVSGGIRFCSIFSRIESLSSIHSVVGVE